ncbi:hypothetical protein SAMN05660293_01446 [Dyadobacter psychrophilus]|uniref:Uncharacterized protein n=1 Tax=Dyadobacter psychrophilus TaxID=651661 RepID=A0A1T5CQE4_9BACT|nr:hypothetical protein SAMN05660293_01446 [Dyadobacter psychrophilus]
MPSNPVILSGVEARYSLVTCFDSAQHDRVSYDLLVFLLRYR